MESVGFGHELLSLLVLVTTLRGPSTLDPDSADWKVFNFSLPVSFESLALNTDANLEYLCKRYSKLSLRYSLYKIQTFFETNPEWTVPPPPRRASAETPKEKHSLHFWFGGGGFFLKKERVFFFRGSALQVFGQVAGLMRTRFCQNYFLGEGFGKTSADSFLNSDVASGGGGVWGGILRLLRYFVLAKFGRAWFIKSVVFHLWIMYYRK